MAQESGSSNFSYHDTPGLDPDVLDMIKDDQNVNIVDTF